MSDLREYLKRQPEFRRRADEMLHVLWEDGPQELWEGCLDLLTDLTTEQGRAAALGALRERWGGADGFSVSRVDGKWFLFGGPVIPTGDTEADCLRAAWTEEMNRV